MTEPALTIRSASHTYPIYISGGLRLHTETIIQEVADSAPSSYLIISDAIVAEHYLQDVLTSFGEEDSVYTYIVPAGEKSKSFQMYEDVLTHALSCGLDRKSVIIALGGGVVGDLAGFAAATYMRGIRYVQMPTTLLAHDSSVGGKTGINHPLGKNMIGAFHPPQAVIYDSETLYSLPASEWRSGLAEVIKHGWINDGFLIERVQHDWTSDFRNLPFAVLNETLMHSIRIKAEIVQLDEHEAGIRAFLNFGHTLAHAIEAELGYGQMTHGEAVAVGMRFAMKLSEKILGANLDMVSFEQSAARFGYNLSIPAECRAEHLVDHMKHDKKSTASDIHFVLLEKPEVPVVKRVEEGQIYELLTEEMSV